MGFSSVPSIRYAVASITLLVSLGTPWSCTGGDGGGIDSGHDGSYADGVSSVDTQATCGDTQTNAMNCGRCGNICSNDGPANTSRTCTLGVCSFQCNAGFVSGATGACAAIAAPRLIAPMTGSTTTSRRPTVHVELPAGVDGVHVDFCRDRACAMVIGHADGTGATAVSTADLPASTIIFWRAFGRVGSNTGLSASVSWEFKSPVRTTPVDTSWGVAPDVNGDGFADVLVAATAADHSTGGRVYVFHGSAGGANVHPDLILDGPGAAGVPFASSIASAGDVNGDGYSDVIVGAVGRTASPGPAAAGRAYIYLGGPTGITSTPFATLGSGSTDTSFGQVVAGAGDVNGDGYADVLVGVPNFNGVLLYLGHVDLNASTPMVALTTTPALRPLVGSPSDQIGTATSGAGDVNGDGLADILIGVPGGNSNLGEAMLLYGTRDAIAYVNATELHQKFSQTGDRLGATVSTAGDVNGDGYADIMLGAPTVNTDPQNINQAGEIFVYLGAAAGIDLVQWSSRTPFDHIDALTGQNAHFGRSLASIGDVNGDGYDDVVVGAPGFSSSAGKTFLYYGSATGLGDTMGDSIADPVVPAGADQFGYSVAGTGDINGDGLDDLIVGSPTANSQAGLAYVYVWDTTAARVVNNRVLSASDPTMTFPGFGISVALVTAPREWRNAFFN